ncbi:hypothetical protein [Methylosinus sp. Ce-a6]|uniref:hypothetical protein n=1 Tax=Methylosinus sp. Ce-a6 TaxID=2172005 RepID=UPI001359E460|nr:hypothetical protein [Methylosinus sp. Ce-a6]
MSEASSGLSLDPDGDGFILSRTGDDGVTARIALSAADILALTRSALALRETSLAQRQPASGDVEAVLATPVEKIALHREMLGDNLLLTLLSPDGNRLAFALPSALAAELAERLAGALAEQAAALPPQ